LSSYNNHSEKIELIKSGKLSLADNIQEYRNRIEAEKKVNAFNFLFDISVADIQIIESKIKKNKPGKLAGMVIAVKDVLSLKDKPLTCSSKILQNFNALYTATAIQNLIDEDAIIIGKTNCDEFAMGSSNENSFFGNVLNPVNHEYVPGGSSGGSAAAVAANLCDAAIGTDTGGSIRQPASFTGVYGLKPTYGRVSRFGLTAFASSFDSIGPFANNVDDVAKVLSVLAGYDAKDSTSVKIDVPNYLSDFKAERRYKIGIPKEYFGEGLNEEIKTEIENQIETIRKTGNEIVEISLPNTEYSIAAYYVLTTAEASSNLARFDGARYGYRSELSSNLKNMYVNSRSEGFGDEVKRRIMLGTFVLSSGYYDAYYGKAQKVRRLIKNDFDIAFKNVDIILTPTSPTTAFKIGEKSTNPLEMYLSDIYTTSANLAGIPAISVPVGVDKKGLPIGMQLSANQFQENMLLNFVKSISK